MANGLLNSTILSVLLILRLTSEATAQVPNLPQSPVDPTPDDCHRLQMQFYALTSEIQEAGTACRRQTPPRIDFAYETYHDCSTRWTKVAWPQCSDFSYQSCVISQRGKAETSTCRSRARANQQQQQLLSDSLKKYEQLTSAYNDTQSLLSDPRAFFKKAAARAVLDAAFPKNSPPRYDVASDVLQYAHEFANKGLRSTRSPLIRSIQQEALDQVAAMLGDSLKNMDAVARAIERFSADADREWRADNPPGYVPETSACRVLGTC